MAPLNRVIIDTDPGTVFQNLHAKDTVAAALTSILTPVIGVDDILALLLALSASPEELEVLLISVTYGNVEVERYPAAVKVPRYLSVKS